MTNCQLFPRGSVTCRNRSLRYPGDRPFSTEFGIFQIAQRTPIAVRNTGARKMKIGQPPAARLEPSLVASHFLASGSLYQFL